MGLHDDSQETITRENAEPQALSKDEFNWIGKVTVLECNIALEVEIEVFNGDPSATSDPS